LGIGLESRIGLGLESRIGLGLEEGRLFYSTKLVLILSYLI